MTALLVAHDHVPLTRVVQRGWKALLDPSYARREGGRWNSPASFPVLYACCSETVARAIVYERLHRAGVVLADLRDATRPQLVEIGWTGTLVDAASPRGLAAAGLPAEYPDAVGYDRTRPLGAAWVASGHEGVVCRSAALSRAGVRSWSGDHRPWGEAALFIGNTAPPRLLRRRRDLKWLVSPRSPA